ncbi:hypothetical protein SAMN05192561_1011076 [Halopenitus malekzadehii]|uniref:Uncharacterized protein n=1 Tax=Halopenitus malekzadehii TaxID=1267564 RepID=A0A1H6I4A5_9EURY|nr:hypothetical protein [Halopenitus malekzadehii]SEH43786.1 hypothetical protein SAMN05192561_1011076 [Halopenitus malekzadehii]
MADTSIHSPLHPPHPPPTDAENRENVTAIDVTVYTPTDVTSTSETAR